MLRFPTSIEIDITGKCNYNCLYCRNGKMQQCDDMDYAVISALIEECKRYRVFNISISGGEPTLHNKFYDIITALGESGIEWSLTTNGSNIDDDMAIILYNNHIKSVFITLAGFSEETECYLKGNKMCHCQTIKAIETCKKYNIPVLLGYLLSPENISDVDAFLVFCKKNGIPGKLMRVEMQGNAASNPGLQVTDIVFEGVLKKFKSTLKENAILGEKSIPFENRFCPAGILSCVVGYDYNVYPCVSFLGDSKTKCGSIKTKTLYEIWNTSEILKEFRMPRIYSSKCALCNKKSICNGGCRAEAYKETGSYKLIENKCSHVSF